MKFRFIYIFLLVFILFPGKNFAQFINIHQWQANYTYTNPALTGIANNPRIGLSRHNFSPRIIDNQNTYEINYDQQISPKAGFIGAAIGFEKFSPLMKRYVAGLQYAYEFNVKENIKLRAGTSLSYVFLDIDTSKMISAAKEKIPDRSAAYIGLGTMVSYKNIYAGFAASNFTEPLNANFGNLRPMVIADISAQAGGFFPVNKSNERSTIVAPYIILYGVSKNFMLAPGVNVNKGIFTGGICYRAHSYGDAVSLLAGVSKG